jgi:hypothetical protein
LSPVNPLEQHRTDASAIGLRPYEASAFQALRVQVQPIPAPPQQLHQIAAPAAEHKHVPAERIVLQSALHLRRPALLVPDNLKSAINRACRYEPEANSTYAEMARHYGTAILPARPFHPRDKAAVEAGVLLVERWILARLRNRQFFSLSELNAAVSELLIELNHRPFKRLEGCRASAFERLDRPAMKPLPGSYYEYAEWKLATVNIDYHVEVAAHY